METPPHRPLIHRLGRLLPALALAVLAAAPAAAPAGGAEEPMDLIATAPRPVELTAAGTTVELAPPATGRALADRVAALAPGERVYLLLRDLHAAAQPGVLYHLYVGLPAGEPPAADDPRHVGDLNFFDAVARTLPLRSYEVTAPLRALAERGGLAGPLTLTIRPAGDPAAAARPVLGRVELVVQ